MSQQLAIAIVVIWLALAVVGAVAIYVGYGFVMSAIVDRDKAIKAGIEGGIVQRIDSMIAAPLVLMDALFNLFWMPILCLDFRFKGWFRKLKVRDFSFPFPDLITERLRLYHLDPNEWAYRKRIAAICVMFLDRKDPKGWHVADPRPQVRET